MEIWVAAFGILLVTLGALVLVWRRRAQEAESTLYSLGSLLGSDAHGSDLLRDMRARVETMAESEADIASYLGALQSTSIGIALIGPEGGFQYVNPVGESLLSGDGERAVLRTRAKALVQRVADSGVSEKIESDIHEPVRRVLTTTAVPLASDGGHSDSVVLYIEDLSAQERLNAMRTDFVANASHELKTPLGALSILAETLAETEEEETRERLAGRLREEAQRMARVIDDVVRLAETESLGIEFERVTPSDLVDEAASSVAPLAAAKGINLDRGEMATGVVEGSSEQIISAVRNLLENAITYTAVKGEPGSVSYGVKREDEALCIEIADTGIGIPDRYKDRVFERFFRVDRARSRESGGTGLGLSIVKNVALAHGGSVRVDSQVGVGSTFIICLPEIQGGGDS